MKIKMDINRWRTAADISVLECEPMYAGSMYVHKLFIEANLYENEVLQAEFRVGGESVAQMSLLYKEAVDEQYALYEALIPSKLFKTSKPKQVDMFIGLFKSNNGELSSILVAQPQSFTIEGDGRVFENSMDEEEREQFNENLIHLTGRINEFDEVVKNNEQIVAKNDEIVSDIKEKILNFKVGEVNVQASEPGAEPQLDAKIVGSIEPNEFRLNMDFTFPRGDKGEAAGFGEIIASATDLPSDAVPTVTVTPSGSNAAKSLAFEFGIPKGEQGAPGYDGADGASIFTTTENYDEATTNIPIEDINVTRLDGKVIAGDILLTPNGKEFRVIAGNTALKPNASVRFYANTKGETGKTGATPEITVTATVDNAIGIPSVEVTQGGTPEAPEINLAFHNMKGEKGEVVGAVASINGEVGDVEITKSTIGLDNVDNIADVNQVLHGTTKLTDQNLNDYNSTENVGWYYAAGTNSVSNTPSDYSAVNGFSLQVYRSATGVISQAFQEHTKAIVYTRYYANGTWSAWAALGTGAFLPLNGGALSGQLKLNGDGVVQWDGKHYVNTLKAYDDGDGDDNYGSEIVLTGHGNTFVGSGEAPQNLRAALQAGVASGEAYSKTSENAYFASDNHLFLYSNCNTIANRKGVILDSNGTLRPLVNNASNLGASTLKWANSYATTFHGALDGTLANARTIDGISFDGSADILHYGTCGTSSLLKAKVATISNSTFSLVVGAKINIKFSNSNVLSESTLNVNGTGAKTIRRASSRNHSVSDNPTWNQGQICTFLYDGTYWLMMSESFYGEVLYTESTITTGDKTLNSAIDNIKYLFVRAFRTSYSDYVDTLIPYDALANMTGESSRYALQLGSQYVSFYKKGKNIINISGVSGMQNLSIWGIY